MLQMLPSVHLVRSLSYLPAHEIIASQCLCWHQCKGEIACLLSPPFMNERCVTAASCSQDSDSLSMDLGKGQTSDPKSLPNRRWNRELGLSGSYNPCNCASLHWCCKVKSCGQLKAALKGCCGTCFDCYHTTEWTLSVEITPAWVWVRGNRSPLYLLLGQLGCGCGCGAE